jgi:hypothetical protein
MFKIRNLAVFAALIFAGILALPAIGLAAHERIDFSINAPFKLRKSNVVLPPGKYILEREDIGEGSTFALYSDLMKKPLALIDTVNYDDVFSTRLLDKTLIVLDKTEMSDGDVPVVEGWRLPGGEEWEVIAVVPDMKQIGRQAEHSQETGQ